MVALKHVFRYLNGTKDWRLRFGRALGGALGDSTLTGEGEDALRCFVDSDYAGGLDDYKLTSGLVIFFVGAVNWRLRKQKLTAQSTTDTKYFAFGVGYIRLTQISYLLNKLGISTILHVFSNSQWLTAIIKTRILSGTAVAHIATQFYLATDMGRDGEINWSYISTAEMLADCFTKPLPDPAFLTQCATMGMIGLGLGNGLGTLGTCRGHGIGTGTAIGNAVPKHNDWLGTFVLRRSTLFDWLLVAFVCCFVRDGRDSYSGGVLSWLEVQISLCQGLWYNWPVL